MARFTRHTAAQAIFDNTVSTLTDCDWFEIRCPFCRRRFSSPDPAHSFRLALFHVMSDHEPLPDLFLQADQHDAPTH